MKRISLGKPKQLGNKENNMATEPAIGMALSRAKIENCRDFKNLLLLKIINAVFLQTLSSETSTVSF